MPLIVPGVAQFTLHGTYAGREVANVLCYQIDTTGSTEGRGDACNAMAGILINEWKAEVIAGVASAYTFTSVSWVDLDEPDGSVGERTSTSETTLPQNGGVATSPMPGNVAILVRKNLQAQRGANAGRMYIVGVPEAMTDANTANSITTGNVAAFQTRMNAFLGDTNQDGTGILDYDSWMVVAHITSRAAPKPGQKYGAPLTGVGIRVNGLQVDGLLASQRRRLRG